MAAMYSRSLGVAWAERRERLRNGGVRLLEPLVAGWVVVVGTDGLGDAPIGHRELGIEVRRALERPRRLIVVEGVYVAQSLIEKLLGFRALRGHGMMLLANAAHESSRLSGRGHAVGLLRGGGYTQRDE